MKYVGEIFDLKNYIENTYKNDRSEELSNTYWPPFEKWALKGQNKINSLQRID
jgi:hypothetical protein